MPKQPPQTSLTDSDEALALLDDLVSRARSRGADAADALLVNGVTLSVAQRLGRPEKLERAEGSDLGLRVLLGHKQAIASSNDWTADSLDELVERALAMAAAVPDDPHCGLADAEEVFAGPLVDPDICDDTEPDAATLTARAKACEDAARGVDGVTNSEGAEASWSLTDIALLASNGFAGSYAMSRHGIGTAVVAGEGGAMERDYEFSSAVFMSDLDDPAEVGERAGVRAVSRIGARKPGTAKVPVVYDPRVANSLVGHLASAINGTAIARGTSFLKDSMGTQVFGEGVGIVDNPHRTRGLRSKPFDAEGMANPPLELVESGVLKSWVLDLRTARQLNLKTTGRAARGVSSPPSPSVTNLFMKSGNVTPHELIKDIGNGFYVVELIGFGVNMITGDYSRGAAGFWIENGEVTYPVSEVTIAGNLKDMFRNLRPANDLEFRYGTNAPTIRVDGMTVAGA
ncbi:MAG: TldD/PmbA family protein [Rhodospirillales bacterium]|nr:MAG: TldD/PmbA family protein [Rhodospirillales bacterium]